jgi:hypothetical protein
MPQATEYERQTSFADHSSAFPTTPHSGVALDAEFDAVKVSLDDLRTNAALIQRDDGALANASVGNDQLKSEVTLGFNDVTTWATATAYRARDAVWRAADDARLYRCVTAHTGGTFATDLAAGYWTLVVDLQAAQDAADTALADAQALSDATANFTISTSAPSGGSNGDVWFQVSA